MRVRDFLHDCTILDPEPGVPIELLGYAVSPKVADYLKESFRKGRPVLVRRSQDRKTAYLASVNPDMLNEDVEDAEAQEHADVLRGMLSG